MITIQLLLVGVDRELAGMLAASARTAEAAAAHKAIDLLAEFAADAAVIDIAAAGTQAAAFMRVLRHPERTPRANLPVIGLLDASSPQEVQRLVRTGIDHLMVKPLSANSLLDLARQASAELAARIATQTYIGPDRRRVDLGGYVRRLDRRT